MTWVSCDMFCTVFCTLCHHPVSSGPRQINEPSVDQDNMGRSLENRNRDELSMFWAWAISTPEINVHLGRTWHRNIFSTAFWMHKGYMLHTANPTVVPIRPYPFVLRVLCTHQVHPALKQTAADCWCLKRMCRIKMLRPPPVARGIRYLAGGFIPSAKLILSCRDVNVRDAWGRNKEKTPCTYTAHTR